MNKVKVVWVDLRLERCAQGLCGSMPQSFETLQLKSPEMIHRAITANHPGCICFEYDDPAAEQLKPLRDTRLAWPVLPVLMFTVGHSEELAVWALRMRLWDYVVKPVSREDLCVRLAVLCRVMESRQDAWQGMRVPVGSSALGVPSPVEKGDRCGTAVSFVEENLAEKISLHEVAEMCGLGPFQFSRAFKQDRGTTFREFLIERRINRALQLFDDPKVSVTDVAFAAGFNDLSYFARVFRRFTGVTPSYYRREQGLRRMMQLPMPEPPQEAPGEWPIAKYSYPVATKS